MFYVSFGEHEIGIIIGLLSHHVEDSLGKVHATFPQEIYQITTQKSRKSRF